MGSKTQAVQAPYQNNSTVSYGYQDLPGTNGAQAVQEYKDQAINLDPGAAQRGALQEQSLQNSWNNDFVSGLPLQLRMKMQDSALRGLRTDQAYQAQNAEYGKQGMELARKQSLLPQLVQTGGTSQGYNTQIVQKPSIWGQIAQGAGSALGGAFAAGGAFA